MHGICVAGFTFGDPHYVTMDGTGYTFNGHGEFWLLWARNVHLHDVSVELRVQVRTEQARHDVQATFTTGVAAQLTSSDADEHESDVITFVVDEFYEHSDNKLQVLVGSELLDFRFHEARVQAFDGEKTSALRVIQEFIITKMSFLLRFYHRQPRPRKQQSSHQLHAGLPSRSWPQRGLQQRPHSDVSFSPARVQQPGRRRRADDGAARFLERKFLG